MRKFYSFVLMATMLLIGTNAWADVHATLVDGVDEAKVSKDGGTTWMYATHLKEAFDCVAPGETAEIVLLKSIADQNEAITMPTLPSNKRASIDLPHIAGQNITLDLNGNDITTATKHVTPFRILKGSLDIEGSGTIIKTHVNTKLDTRKTTNQKDSIVAQGEGDFYGNAVIAIAGTQDSLAADWSVLTIGENVTLSIAEEKPEGSLLKAKTIAITNFASLGYTGDGRDFLTYQAFANSDKNLDISRADQLVPKFGYTTRAVGGYYTTDNKGNTVWTYKLWAGTADDYGTIEGVSDKIAEYKSSLPMGCGALSGVSNTYYYGILQGCAFGVKVTIKGKVYGTKYAIHVHGNINQTPNCLESTSTRHLSAAPYFTHQFPYVKIEKTAIVQASEEGGCIGVYSAGYSVMDIEGSVNGATGVYMKSGNIVLKDANVWSTYSGNDVNWGTANDGGVHGAGGSAIVTESSDAYAGGMSMTVQGDTKITGDGGYAIFDQTTVTATDNEDNKTTTTSIKIEGGTIESGNQGAIAITQGAVDVTSIAGGNVEGTSVNVVEKPGTDQEKTTPVVIYNFIPEGTHTTVVKDGNKDIVVVSQGAAPTDYAHVQGNAKDSVNWIGTGADATEELNDNLTLKELEINQDWVQTLTIPNGKTLSVGRVVLGVNARIIVEAGGKFIVTGEQGIVAPNVSNILIKTSETAQGIFLFHPEVSSNRHPNATVELYSKAYKKANGDYVWQRFGVPTWNDNLVRTDINYDHTAAPTAWRKIEHQDWVTFDAKEGMVPFVCYGLTTTATSAIGVYEFRCPLMGNDNATLKLTDEWNYYANSYMAPINIPAVLGALASNVEGTMYLYRASDNWWYEINNGALAFDEDNKLPRDIDPMQAFIIHRRVEEGENPVINYASQIYTPVVSQLSAAPARSHNSLNKAMVEIVAEDGTKDCVRMIEDAQFSADFDNSYDATKYMNENSFNLFAGEKLGIIATDNLEGTTLSMNTKEQTTFTMTISHVNGMNYAIRDNFTGTEIEMVEGATYMFSTAANANIEGRFEIVPVAKMPTAIENIEATAAAKGIYTITGQFVGNDYHSLPNGVYVVDGKKIVK